MKPRHSRVQENVEKKSKQNLDTSINIKKIIHINYNQNKRKKIVDYLNFLINMNHKDNQE